VGLLPAKRFLRSLSATGEKTGGGAGTLSASWKATDPHSAISLYRYAIGTTSGGADIVNWTNITATTFVRNNLGLIAGKRYYISVMARNAAGLWSLPGTPLPVTAGVAACQTNYWYVHLPLVRR